jgi:hypothetical protein
MLDRQRAAEYLRLDFVEKELDLKMPFSLWLAKAISMVSAPLLKSSGCVPVYKDPEDFNITSDQSMGLLARGCYLLIFPEDPTQLADPRFSMTPFKKGFIRLAELYFQRTGQAIRFYPLAVHEISRVVKVGKPIRYNPFAPAVSERLRIKGVLEKIIHEMYLELGGNTYVGVPLPH